jgi:hypothetical protein
MVVQMQLKTKTALLIVLLSAGVLVGIWHFQFAGRSIFVFREKEPILSWFAVLFGPASTLPAVITGAFSRRIGGFWLVVGSILSLVSFSLLQPFTAADIGFALQFSLPMLLLGIGLILLSRNKNNQQRIST